MLWSHSLVYMTHFFVSCIFLWIFLFSHRETSHSALAVADRVFGPATTTRHVYDVAAHHVVSGAMQGINGNVNLLFLKAFI